MIFCGLFPNSEEALNYFALKRSTTNWGVTGPSQRRYATAYSGTLRARLTRNPPCL